MSAEKNKMNLKSKIERLAEKLYSRTRYEAPEDTRGEVTQPDGESVLENWQSPNIDELIDSDRRSVETHPLVRKIFVIALLFFICAVGAAGLIYFKGDNFVSTKNLDITVNGPVSVSAGAPVDLTITITNKNNAALDTVNLNITYPDGARDGDDTGKSITDTKEALKALTAGEKVTRNERVSFFGTEGATKQIKITVDYKVVGSNAVFTKEKVFELTISSAPISLAVTRPDSVISGEPFNLSLEITSNSKDILKNVVVKAEYPYGWKLLSTSPLNTDIGKSVWTIGSLSPGDKKSISIRGTLLGEDGEERTLRFFVGVGKSGGATIDTNLSSNSLFITIKKPLVDLAIKLNGDNKDEYVAPAGKPIQAIFSLTNNLPVSLQNPQVELRLTGTALDRVSVSPQGGSYNTNEGLITWNPFNTSSLKTLAPGDTVTLSMNFSTLSNLPTGSNQKVDLVANFSAKAQDTNASVSASESRTVKIASEVALVSKSLYSRGPFTNIGPIPPKADTGTTYAINWTLGNTQNDIEGATVVGKLGANVKWLGETSPDGSGLSYDETTRTVTWNVGTLASGAGFSSPGREAYFRIELDPSLGQVGGMPVLVSNIAFTGTDVFTKTLVKVVNEAVTTKISTDPRYVQGDETVVK